MSKRHRFLAFALLIALMNPARSGAQATGLVGVGPRLRPLTFARSSGSEHTTVARTHVVPPAIHTPAHRRTPGVRGALIGAAIGAGAGALLARGLCDVPKCATHPDTWAIIAGGAGIGAAVGFAIDGFWISRVRIPPRDPVLAPPPHRSLSSTLPCRQTSPSVVAGT